MTTKKVRIIDEEKKNSWLHILVITTFFVLIFLNLPIICQSHGHDHHNHDDDHHHHHHEINEPPSFKYSKEANSKKEHHSHDSEKPHWRSEASYENHGDVFLKAMGSTFLISIAPYVILFFVPLDNSKEREPLLKILLSFASGGLLGDAFLHLIPHALTPHDHHHEHNHDHEHEHKHDHKHDMGVGLCVLLGIILFLVVEKFIRIIKGDHGHSHSHSEEVVNEKAARKNSENNSSDNDSNDLVESENAAGDIKIAGYLNLGADFLHNFTDGLAIGASYLAGNHIGYVTTFSILLHEVPHEIGDFAILIQSGCNKKKAMLLQLVTAVGALMGTYVSLLADGLGDIATKWILPFTAGGFIYIATVSVIPELLSDTKFWQSVKEIIALLLGVYMMVLVAQYE